mmetsp:Transcript_68355/g.142484  ORF Transcript_68355/g.142484 Transcript_68355/m.142484 type:complete len:292 (+) Transcript_68355:196-1071(+)
MLDVQVIVWVLVVVVLFLLLLVFEDLEGILHVTARLESPVLHRRGREVEVALEGEEEGGSRLLVFLRGRHLERHPNVEGGGGGGGRSVGEEVRGGEVRFGDEHLGGEDPVQDVRATRHSPVLPLLQQLHPTHRHPLSLRARLPSRLLLHLPPSGTAPSSFQLRQGEGGGGGLGGGDDALCRVAQGLVIVDREQVGMKHEHDATLREGRQLVQKVRDCWNTAPQGKRGHRVKQNQNLLLLVARSFGIIMLTRSRNELLYRGENTLCRSAAVNPCGFDVVTTLNSTFRCCPPF